MPVTAYIGIGSNMGDRKAACRKAIDLLSEAGPVKGVSSFYRTEPIGYREQEDFINAVAAVETSLTPGALLDVCRAIEDRLGRTRALHWGPRTLDLDILLFGSQIVNEPGLVIPHPQMAHRRFVLAPLAEIAPNVMHPVLQRTASQMLDDLKDTAAVMRCGPDPVLP